MKNTLLIFGLLWALGASGQIYIDSYRFGAAPSAGLLLDDYPNAAAAYSLRKLRTAYTGDCVEVRRSSDNTTSNIGFSGNYLDTAALKTFCASTNCFVRTWYDQSVNGRNVVQTIDADQPVLVTSGNIIRTNGDPAIEFDGLGDRMFSATFTAVTNPITTFSLLTFFAGTQGSFPYVWDQGTQRYILYLVPQITIFAGADLSNGSRTNGVSYLMYALYNSTSSSFGVNATIVSGNTGTAQNSTRITLGTDSGGSAITRFKGSMSEWITYHSNQSANQANIRANINSFYNVY